MDPECENLLCLQKKKTKTETASLEHNSKTKTEKPLKKKTKKVKEVVRVPDEETQIKAVKKKKQKKKVGVQDATNATETRTDPTESSVKINDPETLVDAACKAAIQKSSHKRKASEKSEELATSPKKHKKKKAKNNSILKDSLTPGHNPLYVASLCLKFRSRDDCYTRDSHQACKKSKQE